MRKTGIRLPSNLDSNLMVKSNEFSSDMDVKEFLDTFQTFIGVKELEGLAFRTLEDYKQNMRYFTYYLEYVHQTSRIWRGINLELFRSYLYYMVNEKKLKKTTVNIRLRSMKVYLNWLYEEGKLENNISKRLKLLRVEDNKVRTLTDKEIRKMLKVPDKSTYRGLRTFTIMIFMLDCGPRVSEIVNIKGEDVDLREGLVRLNLENTGNNPKN